MNERIKPSIFQANLFYLALAIIFINIGGIVQGWDQIKGLLFTEYIIILLPSLLFILVQKLPAKKFLKLNKISFKQILLVMIITIFTYPLAVFVQGIFLTILDNFTHFIPNEIPSPTDYQGFIYGLFVMGITPGICEEIMFRGVIQSTYDKLGYKKSIIITSLLFAMFHFTLVNFIGPLILGIVFGIMVHKTNSLYTSIIGHALNNSIALSILYVINKNSHLIDEILDQEANNSGNTSNMLLIVIGLLFLSTCFIIVRRAFESLGSIPKEEYRNEFQEIHIIKEKSDPYKYLPIVIVAIIFIFINFKYVLTLHILN